VSTFELPLVEPLVPAPDPEQIFVRLAGQPYCLFLDSAMVDPVLGRYSFVAADPFAFICDKEVGWAPPTKTHHSAVGDAHPTVSAATTDDGLDALRAMLSENRAARRPDLPPFQGGAAGLFSYDLGRRFEPASGGLAPRFDEFGVPALAVGLYDVAIAFDHVLGQAWVISQGFPETEPAARAHRAAQRLTQFRVWLSEHRPTAYGLRSTTYAPPAPGHVPRDLLAGQFPVAGQGELTSNFCKSDFLSAVQQAIDYIYAGDVFQVNLAQRLLHPATSDSVSLYLRLRRRNPAPMAGYFDLGAFQIASASPERFLRVQDRMVETRPIKGTRPRHAEESADLAARDELLASEKDRAENVMIVDLLRNDLSRVCEPTSVRVAALCCLESYRHVHHLVSVVEGRLGEPHGPLGLLAAAFPGGSVTGAPKVRAMEIIAELEPTARGAYCGSLGYVGFDGSMDLSILIRTITAGRGWWQAPVGGGIVAQSDPQGEYEETWHKAQGLVQAMERLEE
jgi:para-aminobenzoate synthetase component I